MKTANWKYNYYRSEEDKIRSERFAKLAMRFCLFCMALIVAGLIGFTFGWEWKSSVSKCTKQHYFIHQKIK